MAFFTTMQLPKDWNFADARNRLEEFKKLLEEQEVLEFVIVFTDDDGETDQLFARLEDGSLRTRVIILRVAENRQGAEICFLADVEFDCREVFGRIFSLDKQYSLLAQSH